MDLGEQEAVATQTSPEENDQLIGLWAQQKAEPIFGRPEIERARACAHAVRCVITAPEVVDITTRIPHPRQELQQSCNALKLLMPMLYKGRAIDFG